MIVTVKGFDFIVDEEDVALFDAHSWQVRDLINRQYLHRATYNPETGKCSTIIFHRLILGITDRNVLVDHINGNTLDNRKVNLRPCNVSQNRINSKMNKNNTSGYRGVMWRKRAQKWEAVLMVSKKRLSLGLFTDPKKAYEARVLASVKHYGEFERATLLPDHEANQKKETR